MPRIKQPLSIPELDLEPEYASPVKLDDDMGQVLALLTGFWRNKRTLLKSSPSGMLFVVDPQLKDIYHVTATENNYTEQGADIACTGILVMAHPSNTGKVWARPHLTATINNAIPLSAGDSIGFSLTNLNMLHLLIENDTEKAIVIYTE